MEENPETRRRLRVALFRMAQGRVPWYCQKATLIVLASVGLFFLVLGILLEVQAIRGAEGSRLGAMFLGICSCAGGLILLLETLVVLPRRLQQLPATSAFLLKTSFLIGEQMGGRGRIEQIEEHLEEDDAENKPGYES